MYTYVNTYFSNGSPGSGHDCKNTVMRNMFYRMSLPRVKYHCLRLRYIINFQSNWNNSQKCQVWNRNWYENIEMIKRSKYITSVN